MDLHRTSHGQHSLPRECYVDPDVFAREQSTIFAQSWIMLGRSADWSGPGAYQTASIGGQPVVMMRDGDGTLCGFHNVCRHRGAQLLTAPQGCLNKQVITCPYHAWSYDCQGALVGAPNMVGVESFDRAAYGLRPIAVETLHGFVFASLKPHPEELGRWLAPVVPHLQSSGAADLVCAARIEYDVGANWKLLFENYSECYHCPTVHPALNRLTPFRGSSNETQEGPILGGPMNLADDAESMSSSGKRVGCWLPGRDGPQRRAIYYFTVFPTCFFSFHPDYILTHRLEPRAVDRTAVVCEFLFHANAAKEPGFDPRDAVEFWDLTNRQDWEVCERVQAGARSAAFSPGPLSDLESIVAAWDRHYQRVMAGEWWGVES